jgi:hypothetical protein
MQPPSDWPAPAKRLTKDEQIERLVRLRHAIHSEDTVVDLKQILSTIIDAVLDTLKS